jgi:hypothetical protein
MTELLNKNEMGEIGAAGKKRSGLQMVGRPLLYSK